MGISLTKILAGAGISTAANALFPGIGMADAFARTAGMGMGSGLMRTAVTPGGSGGQNRFGGPGSPQGAMPTRSFGSTRETVGELKSGFKDWLVDPLQAKKEKREQARDTALAVRLGITGGEYSLTHRPAMSLIKKRSGDVQTNIMILQFRVQQFMARNLSAIASTLGVSKSKIGHEQPDPNKSWFGQILSSLHKDLQQNPIFSTVESVGKHVINIGSILNPFTLGSRAKKGVKSFGEFMQRLAMGKEGFEMMEDPEKLYEKAGLKQDFQTKSVNLMKINNEYQKHQLNMLYNILGATKEMLGIFGGSYQNQKLDLTHDEFEGTLKTHRQLRQAKGMRAMKLETTFQAATRRSIVGRIGSIVGGIRNIGYNVVERARPKQASRRDLYALDYMFNTPGFFDSESGVRGVSDNLDQFIDRYLGQDIDWYNKKNSSVANEFKFWIEDAIEHPKPGHERQAEDLRKAWELGKDQSAVQVSLASTHNAARRVGNIFAKLTGHNIANTDPLSSTHPREARHKFETYTRFGGDLSMAGTQVGSGGERAVNEYHNTGILPAVLRSIPILGALFGIRQQVQVGGLQTRYEEAMRSPYQGPNEDKIFGYGQGGQTGRTGGGILSSLKVSATLSDIDDALLNKLTNKTINVKLVGVGNNVLNDITPIMIKFFSSLYAVGSQLVKDFSKMFDERRKQNKAILIEEPKDNYIDITTNAHGNVFSGGDISDYSGKIVDRPTFFRYDSIHKFAKGAGVMGETGDPEGIFPLAETKNGDLGLKGPSLMRVVLVDINGNPLPISMPAWFQNNQQNSFLSNPPQSGTGDNEKDIPQLPFFGSPSTATKLLSWISGDKSEEKKAIDYNDNTTTTAERQQAIEDKRERKEEERREQEQQAVEEDKKSTLHKIADLLDPRTAIGKLVDKYRAFREKKKEDGFKLPFDISSWISKLGIGLIGNELIKMLPEGFFTGENGLVSKVGGFVGDVLGWMFDKAKKYVEENAFGWFQGAWEHFKEHPLLDAGILMTLFPGTVGKLLVKVAGKAIMNPASIPSIIGVGGMVYNLIDSFSKSRDENGEFSLWKFLKEFFIGSESNFGSIIGKAGTYGYIGLKIGLRFGPHGALLGSLIGGALGSFIGSINSKDENGDFSIGEFLKSFFLGKDSAGGLANGAGNAIKWGLVGAAIGVPFGGIGAIPGFLLGAALGGIIGGVTGYLGYDKLETGSTVSKLLRWKPGSIAYKLANFPGAQFPPFIGPFIYGTIGTILDLGSMLFEKIFGVVNDAWMWLKKKIPFLGDDDDDEEQKKVEEAINKAKAAAEAERTKTVKYQDSSGNVLHINASGKDARYIEAAKTPEERRKRANETRLNQYKEERWIEESRSGEKKYDIKKYVELRKKWDKEDAERNEKYAHEIDIPITNFSGKESVMGFNDFKSTKENAEEYQKLMNEKKDDDAIRFAKGIKAKQDEEDAKRKAKRDAALKKIEVGGSPEELKIEAQRKASLVRAALSAKVDSEAGEDKQGTGFDIKDVNTEIAGEKTKQKELKFDYAKLNQTYQQTESAYNDGTLNPVSEKKKEDTPSLGSSLWSNILNVGKVDSGNLDPTASNVDVSGLKERAEAGMKDWRSQYRPSKEEQARINAYNKAAGEIDLSSAGFGTSAPGPEPVTSEKDKKNEEIPLYRRPENIAKYNAAAQNIDLSSAGFGLSAPGPDPSSVPAVAKASEDASKKKEGTKGQPGGSSGAQTTPATPSGAQDTPTTPSGAPAAAAASPGSTSSGETGELNWIEKLISQTIQGAFKIGETVVNVAKTGYDTAQQTMNNLGIGTPSLSGNPQLDDIGWLSSKKESRGDRSLVAYDSDGGTSYGKYQFASKRGSESMVDFLRWAAKNGGEQGKKLHDFMAQSVGGDLYKLNTGSKNGPPVDAWKKAVAEGMVGDLDERYMRYRFYDKALANLPPDIQNLVKSSKTLSQVLVSTAVQHGEAIAEGKGAPWVFKQAYRPGISVEEFIKNIYEKRKLAYHGSAQYRTAVFNRYREEAGEALALYAYEKNPGAGYAGQGSMQSGGSTSVPEKVFPGAPKISQQLLQSWQISPSEKLVWPAQSEVITSPMGPRRGGKTSAGGSISSWHRGIDVRARQGDPIFAAMGGKVTGTSRNYGQVKIDHGNGWTSRYLHMSGFNVKPGQTVNAGDTIGAAGGIGKGGGSVYTPHLHFEMHKNGQFVDPEGVYYMYGKGGGHTTYDRHSYNGIDASRQIQAKIGVGGDESDRSSRLNKSLSKFSSMSNVSSGNTSMKLSDKIGVGGDEDYRGSQIRSSMNDYLTSKEMGGPEESVKSDNRIIAELKKLQMIMIGVMKVAGKPSIAVSAPQEQGDPKSKGVDGGKFDNMTENMFSQLGGMLGDLNVATTGLGTQIA